MSVSELAEKSVGEVDECLRLRDAGGVGRTLAVALVGVGPAAGALRLEVVHDREELLVRRPSTGRNAWASGSRALANAALSVRICESPTVSTLAAL